MINIKVSDRGSLKLARDVLSEYPARVKKSIRNAAVDTQRGIRAQIPKLLNERYDISKAEIRKQMKIRMVTQNEGMTVGMIVSGSRIPILKFNVVPREPPPQKGIQIAERQLVSSIVIRGNAVVGRPNRFLARMASGHTNIFFRKKDGSGKLDQEFRPAIPELIREHTKIRPAIEKESSARFQKALTRNVTSELKKANEKSQK